MITNNINMDEIIENSYKIDNKEILVITGKKAKCPPGFKILKTNTESLVCIKDTPDDPIIPHNFDNEISIKPIVDLGNEETEQIIYPFNFRDDSFISNMNNDTNNLNNISNMNNDTNNLNNISNMNNFSYIGFIFILFIIAVLIIDIARKHNFKFINSSSDHPSEILINKK